MIEIKMLEKLGKHDIGDNRCVQIRNWFDYRNHICIASSRSPKDYSYCKRVPKSSAINVIGFKYLILAVQPTINKAKVILSQQDIIELLKSS
ncbi:hypothetical protein QQ045_000274 [Rhodiola kirilowii]